MGTQKNPLDETVLLSTPKHMLKLRISKNSHMYAEFLYLILVMNEMTVLVEKKMECLNKNMQFSNFK